MGEIKTNENASRASDPDQTNGVSDHISSSDLIKFQRIPRKYLNSPWIWTLIQFVIISLNL